MNGLALQVQQAVQRDPHAGDLYVFWGERGDLVKSLWHDGLGMSLYAKRLERGRFIWPSPAQGAVSGLRLSEPSPRRRRKTAILAGSIRIHMGPPKSILLRPFQSATLTSESPGTAEIRSDVSVSNSDA